MTPFFLGFSLVPLLVVWTIAEISSTGSFYVCLFSDPGLSWARCLWQLCGRRRGGGTGSFYVCLFSVPGMGRDRPKVWARCFAAS